MKALGILVAAAGLTLASLPASASTVFYTTDSCCRVVKVVKRDCCVRKVVRERCCRPVRCCPVVAPCAVATPCAVTPCWDTSFIDVLTEG